MNFYLCDEMRILNKKVMMNYISKKYKYPKVTSKILDCALEVHKTLGNGYPQDIYRKALSLEMQFLGLEHQREIDLDIFCRGEKIGSRRIDFLVANTISVEITAINQLEDDHLIQVINYLEAYNLDVGLLINFGAKNLEFKRVMNKKNLSQ